MSLLERTAQLSERVAALSALRERANQAEVIEQRAKILTTLAEEVRQLQVPAGVFLLRSIRVPSLDKKFMSALRSRTATIKERFSADRGSIVNPIPGEDFRMVYVTPFTQASKKANNALLDAWRNWVSTVLPKIDDDVLVILAQIPGLAYQVSEIARMRRESDAIQCGLPSSTLTVESLTKLAEEMSAAWQSLAGDGISNAVLQFLRTAGSRDGASYALLTDEVLEWLAAHGLSHSLRIRLG